MNTIDIDSLTPDELWQILVVQGQGEERRFHEIMRERRAREEQASSPSPSDRTENSASSGGSPGCS